MVTDSPLTSAFISMNSPSTRICRPTESYLHCGDTQLEKWLMKYCPLSQFRRRYLTIGIAHNGPSRVCMWASWSCAARSNRSGSWCRRGCPTCSATRASDSTLTFPGNQIHILTYSPSTERHNLLQHSKKQSHHTTNIVAGQTKSSNLGQVYWKTVWTNTEMLCSFSACIY